MATTYDAIIIGTGQAGPALAVRLAGSGMKVAIIERKRFGGTCVNDGCIPFGLYNYNTGILFENACIYIE